MGGKRSRCSQSGGSESGRVCKYAGRRERVRQRVSAVAPALLLLANHSHFWALLVGRPCIEIRHVFCHAHRAQ